MAGRLTLPGARALRALREANAANLKHLCTLQHKQRVVDPVTGKATIFYTDGDVVPCRINPANQGGLNLEAGQQVVAGEWQVDFAWDQDSLREGDRGLIQQGEESETTFAVLVDFQRILRPTSHEAVTVVFANSVTLP